jgi:Flp pilus assembly protein TadG
MKKVLLNEKGQTTIWMVMLLPVFILLLGWSVDVGRILAAKAELYKACDIASHELAKEIDIGIAQNTGRNIFTININSRASKLVRKNIGNLSGGKLISVSATAYPRVNPRLVMVRAKARVPLLFSQLAGLNFSEINCTGLGRIRSVAP